MRQDSLRATSPKDSVVPTTTRSLSPNGRRPCTQCSCGGEDLGYEEEYTTATDKTQKVSGDDVCDNWENDPDNALNWSKGQKWTAVAIVALYCFITPLTSSMMAPGMTQVAETYHITNPTVLALTLSIFLASFALGPLVMSPVSEMYGRTWVLHISNLITLLFNLGCAFAPNTASLLTMRFLSGFWGSAPLAIGGGTIGDLFLPSERAYAMAVLSCGPLFGPAVGPAAAGFIVENIGIKWVFIVISIISGAAGLVGIPFLRETYAPVIRLRKARRSANPEAEVARVHERLGCPAGSKAYVIWVNLSRPIALLFGNFVCFILSLYMAFNYGIYYLMFATFAKLFKDAYGFNAGEGGLCYFGLGLGFFVATVVGAMCSDKSYSALAKKNGGIGTPEMRMRSVFPAGIFLPIGLLWYGWSAHYKIHWIMPIIGTFIFGFGLMTAYLGIQLYLVDAFTYAASATGAASVFRSLLGFAFPLFGQQMSDKMGLGPSNTFLAGIAFLIGIPFPVWIYYKGAAIRERSNVSR